MGAFTDVIPASTANVNPTTRVSRSMRVAQRSPSPHQKATSLYIHSIEPGSGKALACLGVLDLVLARAQGTAKIGFFRPIIGRGTQVDEDTQLILEHFKLNQTFEESYGMRSDQASKLLGEHRMNEVIEVVIARYKALEARCDFVLCEGRHGSAVEFNLSLEMAKNLACSIMIVGSAQDRSVSETMETIQIAIDGFEAYGADIVGIVLNKADHSNVYPLTRELDARYKQKGYINTVIPYEEKLMTPRVYDVVEALNGEVLYGEQYLDNKVSSTILGTMQLQHVLNWIRKDGCLVVTSGDRGDIIVGAMQAHQSTNYPRLSGIVLTGGERPDPSIELLLDGVLNSLPIIYLETDSFTAASKCSTLKPSLRSCDREKISLSTQGFARHVPHTDRLVQRILGLSLPESHGRALRRTLTPKMFSYDLVSQARETIKHIVLPEGTDPRIIKAAAQLVTRKIAKLTLLGRPEEILKSATELGVNLDSKALSIIDPCSSTELLNKYAEVYYQLRKHKGTVPNVAEARDVVMDSTTFGTMMVHCGDADGLVSGAQHTTRQTIRPALQIIKTNPGVNLVSSVFLMCLDHHVLVYGDCAVNPNPTAPELADIAIASAETAQHFGIDARVAMLSYSSGDSGKGCEVEKVREATRLARERRPDILIEGPIQYDAAVDPDVAASKMPNSTVAGQATVFIFPDLNTGNTCYKSIQRETVGAVCIGPVLQGLKKPVNDLSRGCTVEDIVSTVVVTACQAQQVQQARSE
ncbi:Phosphate acetyltransferase [Seminavis robusta]|uniref:Phosphate acetyltransferase n=1 Tax=Seminavis robusta TaxID=568900 RepID=A0A9N8DBH9_9STRA|nr:Phosphate acetyltransferase [Seminavis robusta]|eukprot:Sro76_g041700.1 Phosphate acetyltransferase (753) ;mRNA; f:83661-86182